MKNYSENGSQVVCLPRMLTHVEAKELMEFVKTRLTAGDRKLVVDATETEFIDSSGVGQLVTLLKATLDKGGELSLRGLHGAPLDLFEMIGLTQFFPTVDENNTEEASQELFSTVDDLEMNLTYEAVNDVAVFHFSGILNSHAAVQRFKEQALLAMRDKKKILLDFADLTYFDDKIAADEIANINKLLKTSDGEMRISNAGNLVESLHVLTGEDDRVATYNSVEDALQGWQSSTRPVPASPRDS